MIPCKKCSAVDERGRPLPVDKAGNKLRGLKQVRKTSHFGTEAERLYKCQDCGALWKMTFDSATNTFREIED